MAIELASEEEHEIADEQQNEGGIMDFGYWTKGTTVYYNPRFVSICKGCGGLKHPSLSSRDLYCDGCQEPYII